MRRKKYGLRGGVTAASALLALVTVSVALAFNAGEYPTLLFGPHQTASSATFKQECKGDEDLPPGGVLWHFVLPQRTSGGAPLTASFENAGDITQVTFKVSGSVIHWNVITPDHDILLDAGTNATSSAPSQPPDTNRQIRLSHVCLGEEPDEEEHLTVTKTVETSYDREHFWGITKKVETGQTHGDPPLPKIWLYTDGSGDQAARYTVDVTYGGYEDSNHTISGTITIENDGDLPSEITAVEDVLGVDEIPATVTCEEALPFTLHPGDTLECTYGPESVDEKITGENVAYVQTESLKTFEGSAAIEWGDPASEKNKVVAITDSLEGDLGSVDAADCKVDEVCESFEYSTPYKWSDYGETRCGDHTVVNRATIVETEQSASATLLVNVQCVIWESAWAKASDGRCFGRDGFSNWGWTNPITKPMAEATWDLWAGAGQCDTSKGTHVGWVKVSVSAAGVVSYSFEYKTGILHSGEAFYSGCDKYPKAGKNFTTAPGQYKNNGIARCASGWAIAHAKVGVPDPDFGP